MIETRKATYSQSHDFWVMVLTPVERGEIIESIRINGNLPYKSTIKNLRACVNKLAELRNDDILAHADKLKAEDEAFEAELKAKGIY